MARRALIALVSCALVFVGFPFGLSPAVAASPNVVISQVYGGGGNANAVYTNDFVELFNRGTTSVSLAGWSIQYASAAGTGNFGSNSGQITPLAGSIAPGQHVLVQEAAGTGTYATLPTPDIVDTSAINMSGTGGKVALVTTTTSLGCNGGSNPCGPTALAKIVDLVGWDGANFYEGAAAAGATANQTAVLRKNGGCIDTDNNASDFVVAAPSPRNTSSPVQVCAPAVADSVPSDGAGLVALDANVTISFSDAVTAVPAAFTLSCTSGTRTFSLAGGPISFTLDPSSDFAVNDTCVVSVLAAGITDVFGRHMASDHAFAFDVVADNTPIHDIQGASHTSPLASSVVKSTSGIVTALRANGFYLQDPNTDGDAATSEALFVFTTSRPNVGDGVRVHGTVQEHRSATNNLTTTELTSVTIARDSSANPLPSAVVIGVDRTPPTAAIEDDATSGDVETSGVFDPAADGIDFWESLESMRVEIPDPLITSPSNKYNELGVVANGGAGATGITARGGIAIAADDRNPERILVDDEILKANGVTTFPAGINVGDRFAGSVTGIVDYDFGNFMLELTESPTLVRGGLAREVTAVAGPFDLTIATFNVENLDPGDHTFATMASLIVDNLRSPDLVSLEEIQDNNGETDTGIVDATTTLTMLRDAIVAAGGPTYSWSEIDPVNDMDGGAPGGNIRQVFFYRTDRGLAFVSRPGADPTTPNAVLDVSGEAQLQYSPGRIDPTNTAFTSSRKPLACEFTYKGHRLFVIANHFNSKGGDEPLWGRHQPPVLSSEVQRMQQATIVAGFVNDILAIEPNAGVVVLGDLNDFEFSAPLSTLKAAGLHDLIETLPANERYTYVYEGNSQTLDHILVSDALLPVSTDDVVHVNAEFWDQASDHDPQVVRLLLPDAAGLCTLTRAVVSGSGIANSLCAKLNAAKASQARGDRNAFAGQIAAYVNEVNAQRGKAISTTDADELTMLAGTL